MGELATSPEIALVLICFAVSVISPSIGTSGGVTFAAMATVLPPTAVVPLHSLVEGASSLIRGALLHNFINYRFLAAFTIGGAVGFVAGWPLIGRFNDDQLRIMLGVFFLLSAWAPLRYFNVRPVVGGAMTACLSVLVSATGPLVAALIAQRESDHRVVIATQGACTVFQHWGKAALFAVWGFSFSNYAALLVALTLAAVVGTYLGKYILVKAPQRALKMALKLVVTVLGFRLLLNGLELQITTVAIGSWAGISIIATILLTSCYAGYCFGVKQVQTRISAGSNAEWKPGSEETHDTQSEGNLDQIVKLRFSNAARLNSELMRRRLNS